MADANQDYTNYKVIYVDDDVDDRFLFTEVLREIDNKIDLQTLANGQELFNEMANISLMPTVIFLDVNMPGYNGFECLSHIRSNRSFDDVNVYLISTSATEKNIQTAETMGANGYFSKPTNYVELKNLVNDCLRGIRSIESN
jgi:CheY-like chemotaxis protein